jgi:hypothetical protein
MALKHPFHTIILTEDQATGNSKPIIMMVEEMGDNYIAIQDLFESVQSSIRAVISDKQNGFDFVRRIFAQSSE